MTIDLRVLGPLELRAGDQVLDVGGGVDRRLLAALLLNPNRVVSVARLAEAAWDDRPPATADRQIRNRIGGLRTRLRAAGLGELLVTDHGGYRARVGPAELDLLRFDDLVRQAADRRRDDLSGAVVMLRRALGLWRGPVLAELSSGYLGRLAEARMEQQLAAVEQCMELELTLGRHEAIVAELRRLVTDHPLRERLVGQLMLALHRSGRQADALAAYRDLAERLATEFGLDPGPSLRTLHDTVLRDELAPEVVTDAPRQLPLDLAAFVGREAELALLDRLLDEDGSRAAAVTGVAGVGTTTTTVRWAHRVADRFPDGQLYADLRGNAREPADPAEVVRGFLEALGVPAHRVPSAPDARAAMFRSLTAGRRLLVVLDGARDAAQIRPLLSGGSAVRTVVTSRRPLTEWVAETGALPVVLDLPSPATAAELLHRRLPGRPADPAAADEVVAACGRLPLALAVAAARAAQTGLPLAALVADLRRSPAAGVDGLSASFASSYRALTAPAARLFRFLGLARGPDLGMEAVAALAGEPVARTRGLLAELAEAGLLPPLPNGRYRLHDLLRSYAGDLARQVDSEADRRAALTRLLDLYTHLTHQADRILNPARAPMPLPLGAAAAGVPAVAIGAAVARRWLRGERAAMLAALRQAADEGLDRHVWQLAWALYTFLNEEARWQEGSAVWVAALGAAVALVDRPAEAYAHCFVAVSEGRLEHFAEAHEHMRRSLELNRAAGDLSGEAETLFTLAYIYWLQSDHEQALRYTEESLAKWTEVGHLSWQGRAAMSLGWYHAQLGDHQRALSLYHQALACHQQAGDQANQAMVMNCLGVAESALGRYREATGYFHEGVRICQLYGDPEMEGWITEHLGDVAEATGDHTTATDYWRQAQRTLAALGVPAAPEIGRKLSAA